MSVTHHDFSTIVSYIQSTNRSACLYIAIPFHLPPYMQHQRIQAFLCLSPSTPSSRRSAANSRTPLLVVAWLDRASARARAVPLKDVHSIYTTTSFFFSLYADTRTACARKKTAEWKRRERIWLARWKTIAGATAAYRLPRAESSPRVARTRPRSQLQINRYSPALSV